MRGRTFPDGTTGGLALEALATELAYAAGMCWASVCLLASFRPSELSAPYRPGLPGLQANNCGMAPFFTAVICFGTSEYLRLRRRRDVPSMPDRESVTGRSKPFALATSKSMAILPTGWLSTSLSMWGRLPRPWRIP